jgi:hypothetical protein
MSTPTMTPTATKTAMPTITATKGTRPGFGCGDTNHHHTGPPGNHKGVTNPCMHGPHH